MSIEKELINKVNKMVANKQIGLFCHHPDIALFQYICDLPKDGILGDKISYGLKDAPYQDYVYIYQIDESTFGVHMDNKYFSLSKEITKGQEKILFYYKIPPKNPNPLPIEVQLANALKKIS